MDLTPYLVERALPASEGHYAVDGVTWVQPDQTTAEFEIHGNLQPITGEDMKLLPDGFKRTSVRKLYTKAQLKTIDEDNNTSADFITLEDGKYQVQVSEPWAGRRLKHYKVLLVKQEKSNA